MTREEAIIQLEEMHSGYITTLLEEQNKFGREHILLADCEALTMAISGLQKQIPMKPKEYEDKYYGCPVCGNVLMYKWMVYPEKLMPRSDGLPYCLTCGQAIDWSDNE